MKTFRMPQGWEFVGTNDTSFGATKTKRQLYNRDRKFANAIRNISPITEKDADKAFENREANNERLKDAFKQKKLKSPALIKKAKKLCKDGAKSEGKITILAAAAEV